MMARPITSEIIGKAHKLIDALVSGAEFHGFSPEMRSGFAAQVHASIKIHAGRTDDMLDVNLRGLPAIMLRLPASPALIEFEYHQTGFEVSVHALCKEVDAGIQVNYFVSWRDTFMYYGLAGLRFKDGDPAAEVFPSVNSGQPASDQRETLVSMSAVVMATLCAMNCSNVARVDRVPPAALNKKRLKVGKVPLYTYKTLHVVTNREVGVRADCGSDRSAPRLHLRRGHVRRIGDDRMVWVSACMVGDDERGRVDKAYALTHGVQK